MRHKVNLREIGKFYFSHLFLRLKALDVFILYIVACGGGANYYFFSEFYFDLLSTPVPLNKVFIKLILINNASDEFKKNT